MMYSPQEILHATESLLKYDEDERLEEASPQHLHNALGRAVMIAVGENWARSRARRLGKRKAFYFSAEYLIGRLVYSNLFNLGILDEMRNAFAREGVDLACLEEIEDAALGNGGLGRLAACYLDSAVTCGIPLSGYGLRYRFGLFKQSIENGAQRESADDWTRYGDPWSYRREKHTVRVRFADQTVLAVPYDTPIIGYHTDNVGTLRLWQCEAEHELDFDAFNQQDYARALAEKNRAEDITRVLYPNDSTWEGKRLRVKQQYFLSSASLQDMLRTYKTYGLPDYSTLPELFAVQLNDTHPAMSIPELIRLLMADGLDFDTAFEMARKVFSYTNHTVMSEALERWDMELLRSVVPEICDILLRIEEKLRAEYPDTDLHILRDNRAQMADLSVYMSRKVNGVAQIHTEILKNDLFRAWNECCPGKILNVTNGITPRRWLGLCNAELTDLIRGEIGEGFLRDLDRIGYFKDHICADLAERFNAVKMKKKQQLSAHILKAEGMEIPPEFVFDVQVKRAHEYKRQLMNALGLADLYFDFKNGLLQDVPSAAFIFGAKAAPGYRRAKAVIRYINRLADLVNNDPVVREKMRIVFVQNYNCSYAEHIIPAADISEQISTAGTEASGTGVMKLMLNGAVTLGTMDGATVEIVRLAGTENNYIFGGTVEENKAARSTYNPKTLFDDDWRIRRAVNTLVDGTVPTDDDQREIFNSLIYGENWQPADNYLVLRDFESYREARLRALRDWTDRVGFAKKCLYNVASAGYFSSDRAVRQYADNIWNV
ncbi:MAG: glycogen/starch/alpha-glucan family phosphorylase [Oscillospiraceae bacterium]|nr:glycogen/starch/alpha-glucan family phosphorylase [Oscillospiraceae bacterium]